MNDVLASSNTVTIAVISDFCLLSFVSFHFCGLHQVALLGLVSGPYMKHQLSSPVTIIFKTLLLCSVIATNSVDDADVFIWR
jgi:hypothetical protein